MDNWFWRPPKPSCSSCVRMRHACFQHHGWITNFMEESTLQLLGLICNSPGWLDTADKFVSRQIRRVRGA